MTKAVSTIQEIYENIINYGMKHYSKVEESPVGVGTALYEKNRIIRSFPLLWKNSSRKMIFQDLEDIPMTETEELLQSTIKPQIQCFT